MKTWWGAPYVRWPHASDSNSTNAAGQRLLLIGGEYYTVESARDLATDILRILMEDAASRAVKNEPKL